MKLMAKSLTCSIVIPQNNSSNILLYFDLTVLLEYPNEIKISLTFQPSLNFWIIIGSHNTCWASFKISHFYFIALSISLHLKPANLSAIDLWSKPSIIKSSRISIRNKRLAALNDGTSKSWDIGFSMMFLPLVLKALSISFEL